MAARMKRPWGVHAIGDMIAPYGIEAGLPDGRVVRAVPEPYHLLGLVERFRAASWVFTGRAHAVVWPKHGDLEQALASGRQALSESEEGNG